MTNIAVPFTVRFTQGLTRGFGTFPSTSPLGYHEFVDNGRVGNTHYSKRTKGMNCCVDFIENESVVAWDVNVGADRSNRPCS